MNFTISPSDWPVGSPHVEIENKLKLVWEFTFTIEEGSYKPDEMALTCLLIK